MNFIVETSARHLHVTREVLETLFGAGFQLSNKKDLSQPGQFATNEKVTVVGPKGQLNMSILGPERKETQVEVSFTDARALGLVPPVRESGDIAGSCPCRLVGPCGEVELSEGVIVAKRHIHMTPADAEAFQVHNGDVVWVRVNTGDRSTVFGDVVVRVSEKYALAMHIDTDEANAAHCAGEVKGEIVRL
ncbi:MAG: phosphate propanoyltransferase [Oscillospiraceae bacterium]|jgi:putative phosphotransacetylase|nr:phosphate propanoyltransferase [Oscillospiraceae bacterium]